ncbi:tungstate transport system substrate-binding protein [Desulfacinum infernum DSM 9756]|uniref:Tungstate transport system substrate-binding protein n=2 Tax=Desulfacinum infernum TaxID=35837 RepID=A0A1M4Y054_9BACT|nr:tungstate transport system substrate-binding protein [Desulfacinum infernum DSM 9756]
MVHKPCIREGDPKRKGTHMRRTRALFFALLVWLSTSAAAADPPCTAVYGNGQHLLRLATGSPGELGLLEELAAAFNADHDSRLCWIKAGSGKSLQLLRSGRVDMVMVHAPEAEKKAVSEGWATQRTLLASNEFYVVGPASDPASVRGATDVVDAYRRIAEAEAVFLSRGDNSGTHKKERMIWSKAGIQPRGRWYMVTGTFMWATLKKADEVGGYFMTDSSTWVAARKDLRGLRVLFRGDPLLVNVYHALCAPPQTTEGARLARRFIEFLASDQGQRIIRHYGVEQYGEPLYNDAAYAAQFAH